MSLVRWSLVATGVVLVAALPASCSMSSTADPMAPTICYGPSCDGGALNLDHYSEVVVGADANVPETGSRRDPLCGTTGCNPDDEVPVCPSSNGPQDGGDDGATSDGGVDEAGGDASTAKLGCYVQPADSGTPTAQCQLGGSGVAGDPCLSPSDCAPGYACVGKQGSQTGGQCRQYCCAGPDRCASGTFCAGRVLLDPNAPADQMVPVCVTADICALDEPYPCDPLVNDCKCTDNTACTVVRADGTTSCLPPGTGVTGQACTCATGGVCTCAPKYVCSYGTQTCQKLCSTSGESCSGGICQSSPFLPVGFGICTLAVDAGS
jgi:hypothetical protein